LHDVALCHLTDVTRLTFLLPLRSLKADVTILARRLTETAVPGGIAAEDRAV